MVAQIILLPGKSLELLVLRWRHAKGSFGDLGGQDTEVSFTADPPLLPFIGQVLTDGDAAQTLVDPILRAVSVRKL